MRSLSPWPWLESSSYQHRLCDLTSAALQQTLSHKKKPMLVPAPCIHPVIGSSSSSSVMFGFMPGFSCYLFEMVLREVKTIAI